MTPDQSDLYNKFHMKESDIGMEHIKDMAGEK